ncbi:hypothetical protein H7B90_23685 [Cohnella xylanilytica]|uniref:Uncharacterized protein n=1 Tax=Cohnella xylanilytica TaxID=557555 RepID=A0A841U813_9BACL|nr:hypothetical protein [Cohnella xylanilytica]MBB6694403.1 hypothetical protein [Cohnella xylanilytica]
MDNRIEEIKEALERGESHGDHYSVHNSQVSYLIEQHEQLNELLRFEKVQSNGWNSEYKKTLAKNERLQAENTHLRGLYDRERAIADSEVERRKVAEKECERLRIALHTHQSYDKTASELHEENELLQVELERTKYALEVFERQNNEEYETRYQLDEAKSELEQVKAERDNERKWRELLQSDFYEQSKQLVAKDEVLEWYGDGSEDGGDKARDILSRYKEKGDKPE